MGEEKKIFNFFFEESTDGRRFMKVYGRNGRSDAHSRQTEHGLDKLERGRQVLLYRLPLLGLDCQYG
ncbi:hypothetical protein HKBW3S42_02062 [Candidatus Hakubella thermalkaliphila]|uniref:Uncharacterized protein n=1 Tax=Candidatus Hakubella thermalkaliphila TaxID=2754717 RepID=A0A6V8PNC5_9ACTN|nr:hypothetical protein HKBW3S42_01458 [Candidatus Hakubella thermalkaliphila]GFP33248.1 hypothetical protein HKBW3S42_01582 [Candidatus Hakubella thermalkaliphila]GFP33331.1 hypothetical protein HKBW3S42_01666 [Candidatus Hakubella thermalkaliphila]GFP33660.1 hypothetical protein HKBW3S42_01997 [Candidatus Hakubella thermalkaliphila]GFP33723.1 hypothetical protein HKBW3S42_02062 [Candidatus Hakubella thermalkaliphila]